MSWENLVFGFGNIALAVNLLPTVLNPEAKVPLKTSIPTAVVLGLFTAAFLSLGMVFSMVTALTTTLLWAAIAVKRHP